MFRDKALAPPKACYPVRARACDHVVDVQVMAALFQHEATAPPYHPAPVTHEEGTVIGADMFVRLKRHDGAKGAQYARELKGAGGFGSYDEAMASDLVRVVMICGALG